MKKSLGVISALTLGLGLALAAPTAASADPAGTIYVPQDFNPAYSDTRPGGHYEVDGDALRVWTESSAAKVAEYVDTDIPLADVGEPFLDITTNSGTIPPGFQLVVDFDNDGTNDGILVGEPSFYGDSWWLNNAADGDVKARAPHTGSGSGSNWFGTLDEWRAEFPTAVVSAFGFSLGSGVVGDHVINAINFADTTYTFAATVTLSGKDDCKSNGWATSTQPVYRNQGQCVSSFASTKSKLSNFSI